MNNINDLPAFPPASLTKEQAEKLAQIAKEARERYKKNKIWKLMQEGKWHCACCNAFLEPIDSTHVRCPKCGLKHRLRVGKIQTKGNMMEDYE